jgi:micrococcal nuclease
VAYFKKRRSSIFLAVISVLTLLASCAEEKSEVGETWSVTEIIDGDTIYVEDSEGNIEKVRLIGIDTPERNECGFEESKEALVAKIRTQPVALFAGATNERDRYDRLLRYVEAGGVDVGLELIKQGYAIARYDSRDGYGAHDREAAYISADGQSPNPCAD